MTSCANFSRLLSFTSCVNFFLVFSSTLFTYSVEFLQVRVATYSLQHKFQNIGTTLERIAEHLAPNNCESHWLSFRSTAVAWAWIGSVWQICLNSEPRSNTWTALRLPLYHLSCNSRTRVRSCCLVLTESIKLCNVLQTFISDHRTRRILALYFPASRLPHCDFLRVSAPPHLRNPEVLKSCVFEGVNLQITSKHRAISMMSNFHFGAYSV